MLVNIYTQALELKNKLEKTSLKKGRLVFKNIKGEMKFGIQFEKNLDRGLTFSLFASQEEMATRESISSMTTTSMVDSVDALVLSKEITISFIAKEDLTEAELETLHQAGIDVPTLKRVPYFDFQKQLGVYDSISIVKLHRFVEQVFAVILLEDNFKLLCQVLQKNKKQFDKQIPVIRYNQRTKQARFQEEYEAVKRLEEFPEYRPFFFDEASPLLVSEIGEYGKFKRIQEKTSEDALNYTLELKFGLSPLQYIDLLHFIEKKMTLQIADNREVIDMYGLKDLEAKELQLAFLEVLDQLTIKPILVITRGFFGQYLKNTLQPIADRLGISIKMVDHLPVLDRQTIEDKIAWILENEGISLSLSE